jgi:hypothetical protein
MEYIIALCFRNAGRTGQNTYIVRKGKAFNYTNSPGTNSFSKNDILFLINYILDNSFVKFGDKIYKQIKGIPQGSNASSALADLTLIAMEHRYVTENSKLFNKSCFMAFRYVDDLFIIGKEVSKYIKLLKDIYHNELNLERTNSNANDCNFLDLNIKLIDNKIKSKIYNKTDDYNFEVMKYPHFNSNIPHCIIGNVIYGELLRFTRGCSFLEDYIVRCKDTISQLLKNNYPEGLAIGIFKAASKRNSLYREKYNISDNEINNLLCI